MYNRMVHSSICASCRLRSSIAAKQVARSSIARSTFANGGPYVSPSAIHSARPFSIGRPSRHTATSAQEIDRHAEPKPEEHISSLHIRDGNEAGNIVSEIVNESPTQAAKRAREEYGDTLPEAHLAEEAMRVYERLYGAPVAYTREGADLEEDGGVLLEDGMDGDGTGLLKESVEGTLEEVVLEEGEVLKGEEDVEDGDVEGLGKDDRRLMEDINAAIAADKGSSPPNEESRRYPGESEEEEDYVRAHPLTVANRFGTSPSTLATPQQSLVEPIEQQLINTANVHLTQAAHRVFGGVGLPYSTSTPILGRNLPPKPIGLDASQSKMSDIEGDAFLATLMPGMYASVMSVLVETRKRLGTAWAEGLVKKAQEGELRILDAGGAGAGVLAVREMLKAEWERMHENDEDLSSSIVVADGKVGGAGMPPPLGSATVLTASDVLRKRASKLLENTTFVPRLPDYLHTEEARTKGKFDLIIAPHTLWPLREDYMRKSHLQNLWGMLSQEGGVLLLLEKGIPRGFEIVAGARHFLLENRLASTDLEPEPDFSNAVPRSEQLDKDIGMIIAPCTNHASCPMYEIQGRMKGRRDYCHFEQRYVRPPFLQRILGAKDKNWEDVKFSYLSVMRGRDLRSQKEQDVVQGDVATTRAFEGYGGLSDKKPMAEGKEIGREVVPHSLSLPRAVLPPLKRQGHVILDLCTPSGTLERWTVPKSYSRLAFHDARKSSWGDLWALGAKTSVPRVAKIKKRGSNADMDVKLAKGSAKRSKSKSAGVWDADEYGRVVRSDTLHEDGTEGESHVPRQGGSMRKRLVKGVRDKRDKRGDGNGRRKFGRVQE